MEVPDEVVNVVMTALLRQLGDYRECPKCHYSFIPEDMTLMDIREAYGLLNQVIKENDMAGEKEDAKQILLEKMTVGNLIGLTNKVKSKSEHNITDESDLKIFFGDPAEGKVMKIAAMGAFGENEDGMFLVMEPAKNENRMIDDLIDMLEGLRGDDDDCQCPKCIVERALNQSKD